MVYIHFTLDGEEKTEIAVFDDIKDMQCFLKTFNEEVLNNYPNATNIRLGKCYVGVNTIED
jgi:hypothetical protein